MSPFFTFHIDAALHNTGLQTFVSPPFITVSFDIIIQKIKSIPDQMFVNYSLANGVLNLLATLTVWYAGIILNFRISSMLQFSAHIFQRSIGISTKY